MIYIRTQTVALSLSATGTHLSVRNAHTDEKLIRHYVAGHNRGIKRRSSLSVFSLSLKINFPASGP
jgi:hypothetical protein